MNFYETAKEREDGSPAKPDETVVDVCLNGVIYSAYLALHYFRKNPNKGGKIVSTSSMCGLYPGTGIPLYTAAKHGVSTISRIASHSWLTVSGRGFDDSIGSAAQAARRTNHRQLSVPW